MGPMGPLHVNQPARGRTLFSSETIRLLQLRVVLFFHKDSPHFVNLVSLFFYI